MRHPASFPFPLFVPPLISALRPSRLRTYRPTIERPTHQTPGTFWRRAINQVTHIGGPVYFPSAIRTDDRAVIAERGSVYGRHRLRCGYCTTGGTKVFH